MIFSELTTEFKNGAGFPYDGYKAYGKKSPDGKTFSWYSREADYVQSNQRSAKYYVLAIG